MAEEAASITRGSHRTTRLEDEEGLVTREGAYAEYSVRVENWYYDRGSHDFIYVLTFIGGRLANIKTSGYGGRGDWGEAREERYAPSGEGRRIAGPRSDLPASPPEDLSRVERATTGRIDLVGSPYGAKVYLNGYYAGNVPCTLEEVEAGRHNLLVTHKGYLDWRERIRVKADVTLWLAIHLEPEKRDEDESDSDEGEPATLKKLYKWTDETGRIHITDLPPPDTVEQ